MIVYSTFKAHIQAPDCDAILTFKRGKYNEESQFRCDEAKKPDGAEKTDRIFKHIAEKLIKVENMFHEDGTEVKAEEITSCGIDESTMAAIIIAYWKALMPAEALEKKDKTDA